MVQFKDLNIAIFQEEDWSYYAEVKNLPWCFSMGETLQELSVNLKEAISSYMASIQKDLDTKPFRITKKDISYA
jgi:predicted RNase H-like HicB family nuclease